MDARAPPAAARRLTRAGLVWIIRHTLVGWVRDGAPSMGAAIAFYTLFATGPLLLMVLRVADAFMGAEAVQRHVLWQLHQLLGDAGFGEMRTFITHLNVSVHSGLSTLAGVLTLLFGASSVFAELQNAINRIWHAQSHTAVQGLWHALRARLLAFALVFGVGFLLMVLLIASSGLAMLASWLGTFTTESHRVVWALDTALGFGLATLLFAMIYKYVPREPIAWGDVWVGALVTAVLFSAGKVVILAYVARLALNSLYGVAGSFLLLLLWLYYSAQIFLLGAEFTYRYAQARGSTPMSARAPSSVDR